MGPKTPLIDPSPFGTPKTINFTFGTNGKLLCLCVPIFKHITVCQKHADGVVVSEDPDQTAPV